MFRLCKTVLLLFLLAAARSGATVELAHQHRRLLQASITREPQVQATTGKLDKIGQAAAALGSILSKTQHQAPAAPTTIVLQQPPQQAGAALPTSTTGGININTDTPVTITSPIEVSTPQRHIKLPKGGKGWGLGGSDSNTLLTGLLALVGYGNFLANAANAGGSITTAVGTLLNAFLPDCPPYNPNAPPVPGCELSAEGKQTFLSRWHRPGPSTPASTAGPVPAQQP